MEFGAGLGSKPSNRNRFACSLYDYGLFCGVAGVQGNWYDLCRNLGGRIAVYAARENENADSVHLLNGDFSFAGGFALCGAVDVDAGGGASGESETSSEGNA